MAQGTAPSPLGDKFLTELRVTLALNSLSSLHPAARKRIRSLNYSGFFLCLSGLLCVWAVDELGAGDVADIIALRILAYACFLYGGLGLWALLVPGAFEGTSLAPLRGMRLPLGIPVFVTLSVQIFLGVILSGLPAVALAAALSENDAIQAARWAQLAWCLPFALAFSLSMALLGALSLSYTKRRPRWTAILLLVLPYLFSIYVTEIPNLLSGLLWGFHQLIALGAP